MGIQIASSFDLFSTKPLDSRQQFTTLADMMAFPTTSLSEGLMTYCLETKKFYVFDSSNPVDPVTGQWKEYTSGGEVSIYTDYSALPTVNSKKEVVLVENDYIDTTVIPNVIHSKGFYLYDTTIPAWVFVTGTSEVETSKNEDNSVIESVEIVTGSPENISCTQTVTVVGNETTTVITANVDSSDTSILQAGDVISIIKEINGIVVFEYHFDDEDELYNPFG